MMGWAVDRPSAGLLGESHRMGRWVVKRENEGRQQSKLPPFQSSNLKSINQSINQSIDQSMGKIKDKARQGEARRGKARKP